MSECCRNNGDIVLCLANCVISRYVDKKLNEEPKKWVIIFVIRVWIGYAVDAGAVIFLWLKRMDGRLQGSHTVLCGRGPTTAYNTDSSRGQEMGSHSEFIPP